MRFQPSDRWRIIWFPLAPILLALVGVFSGLVIPPKYTDKIPWKWVRFAAMTLFFIVFSMRKYRNAPGSLRLWCIFLIFLAVHVLGVGYLWHLEDGFSTIGVAIVGTAEWICMALVIYWLLGITPDFRREPGSHSKTAS